MADSIPSMNVYRKCKQEKPVDQFISKTKSSLACGRPTTDCLDCRNRRALGASKRTAEQAELSPVFREGLPLIDLQLGTPITTSTRTDAPITLRPGPSAASQEGVRLGTPIESPVSSLSIYPRPTRGGRNPRPPAQLQQPAIERPEHRDFELPDPDWARDLSHCPLSDKDKDLREAFWTELENDRMEHCARYQETWFDMGLKDGVCKRCMAKDKNKRRMNHCFFSRKSIGFWLIHPLYFDGPLQDLHEVSGQTAYLAFNHTVSLKNVQRQQGDDQASFRLALEELRGLKLSIESWKLLSQRVQVKLSQREVYTFDAALRIYRKKARVNEYNYDHLVRLKHPAIQVMAKNIGSGADKATSEQSGNLAGQFPVCIGARLMITQNIWQPAGLVNGAQGIVYDIDWAPGADTRRDSPCVIMMAQGSAHTPHEARLLSWNVRVYTEAVPTYSVARHYGSQVTEHHGEQDGDGSV
ncbi:uncharacterized protein FPOAC1_012911 [Fusarium poae]|uniref:uncharacterized protein n=1 Tax=Fusarium poae TaxID=36050 RepID=UPI001D049A75|nr:uncharacterized protein FPOAC1_012911 [Fusarium poae]KAG8664934.1 hypothetical protein FPOAC1_012911 [Fusarium poae]